MRDEDLNKFGIYLWRNLLNGRVLVGQVGATKTFKDRKTNYLSNLRKGSYGNPHFQKAWDKYGQAAFVFELVEDIPLRGMTRKEHSEFITKREQFWVDHYRAQSPGVYNLVGPVDSPRRGAKNSEEHNLKVSAALKGRKTGPLTEETKAKMSVAHKNLGPRPREWRDNISKAKMGDRNPMFGRALTQEHRSKISAAGKGRVVSEELKKRISEAQSRPVVATNKITGEVEFFMGQGAAQRAGFSQSSISACILGKRKSHANRFWRLATEQEVKNHKAAEG